MVFGQNSFITRSCEEIKVRESHRSSLVSSNYLNSPGTDWTRYLPDPRAITVNPFPRTFSFFADINKSSVVIS